MCNIKLRVINSALKNAFHTGILCWINQGKVRTSTTVCSDRNSRCAIGIASKLRLLEVRFCAPWASRRVKSIPSAAVCLLPAAARRGPILLWWKACGSSILPPFRSYIIILTISPPILTNSPPTSQNERIKFPARSAAEWIMNQLLDMQWSIKRHEQIISCKS